MSINVLYVTHATAFHGGASRSLYELIKNIDPARVSPFLAYTSEGEVAASIQRLGVPAARVRPFRKGNPVPLLLSTATLIRFILKHKIDIIHNNQCCDAYNSWLAGKLARIPIVIHHRDPSLYRLDRFLINHVDCNIAISSWYNREMLRGKGIVILNGINIEEFPCSSPKPPSHGEVKVGVVGRVDPKKGIHVFIEAVRDICTSHQLTIPLVFQVVGDWDSEHYRDYKRSLYGLREQYNLEGVLEFRDWQIDVVSVYEELDICVVPSLREPFGRVIIEAMACYRPVIATSVGGALDVVTDETGILVPPNDPQALAAAILFLAENPALRVNMGRCGRKRVEQCFTIENTLSKIYALYEEILNHRTRRDWRH